MANIERLIAEKYTQSSVTDAVLHIQSSSSDKSVIRTTEITFSAPDSVGNQHKVNERTMEQLNDISQALNQSERIITEQQQTIDRQAAENSELRTKLEAVRNEKTTTSTRSPPYVYALAFVTGALAGWIIRQKIKLKKSY